MIITGVTGVGSGDLVERELDDVGDFINRVEMREEIVVKNFNVLLTVVVDDSGDGFERVKNTPNNDNIGVEVL